ncbi:hypothetical protein PRIPAC_74641 [Pristionchus pacificus]|uniref:Uncharacterized protein n=1 Tax=Pristionchus pacificus TaxID=54126 RepID=A0A2A6B5D1_PRIPA|nr:hypothetical protein PRIPAC_74641 [Pristionchus pacificus]|eukprot:PDM61063.1 hypothetical protein PRIPAC_54869 [Pristionchus pacificus]
MRLIDKAPTKRLRLFVSSSLVDSSIMSRLLLLFISAALIAVTHCRVTFTHSEVLQQTDLDATKTAKFKCDNGCYIYSSSQDANMYISDGTKDVSNFLVMGQPDKGTKTELPPWNDYKLVWKGDNAPPSFVFYAVDKLAPYTDTPVHAVVGNEAGILIDPSLSRSFTLLRNVEPAPPITFEGEFEARYPQIYATGYDALIEDECKPVYEARSQSSMLNSWLYVASPILTVDKGPAKGKTAIKFGRSSAFTKKPSDSSIVYKSPGYVGCSYITGQLYSNTSDTVLDSFSADVKRIDFSGYLNVPTENESVKITVNNKPVNLYGAGIMRPFSQRFDGDGFDVTISWIRTFTTSSSFALQFDLGVFDNTVATTPKTEVTTSTGARATFISSVLAVVLLLASVAETRVTFTYSEVLQQSDIPNVGDRAPFKCDNGCKAYTDSASNNLLITQYDAQTDLYPSIITFSNMGGALATFLPEPYELKAGKNYFIENRGDKNPTFVFYVVDTKAPNINTQVMIIGDENGNDLNGKDRIVTTLSSKYDAHRYNQFVGGFPGGYPRIYSTGFDAVGENECQPLYQAKTPESSSLAAITVFSPISTVDYGYAGDKNVHVKWNKGYVGCSYTNPHSYSSTVTKVAGNDRFVADSIDVNAVYFGVQPDEMVMLRIDEMVLDFCGTGSYAWTYDKQFDFAVVLQWERKSQSSNWAVQLDFGTLKQTGEISPAPQITCKADPIPTTTTGVPTTSSSSSMVILTSIVVAILAML